MAASLAVAAASVELALRWLAPVRYREPPAASANEWRGLVHRRSAIPGLVYELVPGVRSQRDGVELRINTLGMRDDEPLPDGRARRILLLGDSVTFGFGVAQEDTFASLLEEKLRIAGGEGEVLNAGVGGYSTVDEAAWFVAKAASLAPSLVVLVHSLNDAELEPLQPLHAHFAEVGWWQHWHLLRLGAQSLAAARVWYWGDGNANRARYRDPANWQRVEEALASIASTAAHREVPVLLAQVPVLADRAWRGERYAYRGENAQVRAAAERLGIFVLDLTPTFSRRPRAPLRVSADDDHPNAEGHRMIADALWRRLSTDRALGFAVEGGR